MVTDILMTDPSRCEMASQDSPGELNPLSLDPIRLHKFQAVVDGRMDKVLTGALQQLTNSHGRGWEMGVRRR